MTLYEDRVARSRFQTISNTHDFDNVEQVTVEDDFVYGFEDLHVICGKVEPQTPQWRTVYDDAVFQSNAWKNIENVAQFWKLYLSKRAGSST